jgi:predicted phage terminase large subunit-like protein
LADYSVCTTWGFKAPNFYLLNVLRKKLAYPDLKRAVREQSEAFKSTVILIEDHASGIALIQDLIEEGLSQVIRYKTVGNKEMRLHAQTATIENGFVHLPENAHWLPDYLHEMTMFPNGRFDDQVDSTAQALAWTKMRPPEWGLFEQYREEFEARDRDPQTEGPIVRLLAPVGIGAVQVLSGKQITVPENLIVEVSTYDAKPLMRDGWLKVEDGE